MKLRAIIITISLILSYFNIGIARAQSTGEGKSKKDSTFICDLVEVMPSFHGGIFALKEYLRRNVKYPKNESHIQGRVICSFIISKDGSINDIKVVKGLAPDFDKEAIRVISKMPKWIPGAICGKRVDTKYTLPITFTEPLS